MAWARYFLYMPFFIMTMIAARILAPIAVLFQRDWNLRWPFRWMDTLDNDLRGDGGWKAEHCPNCESYLCMTLWMLRNGGNYAAYYWFGCKAGEDRPLFRRFYRIGNKKLELFFGWNLPGVVNGCCKYALQIRIRSANEW